MKSNYIQKLGAFICKQCGRSEWHWSQVQHEEGCPYQANPSMGLKTLGE